MLSACRGKYFIHNLVFYKGDRQRHGREFFTNLDSFLDFCPFRLLEADVSTNSAPESTIETCTLFQNDPKG